MRCKGSLPPELHGCLRFQLRWDGYDIQEFRINITGSSDVSEVDLLQTTIPFSGQVEYVHFSQVLPGCMDLVKYSLFLVSATVFSRTYGESIPSLTIETSADTGIA